MATILIAETLEDFKCNLQGCCCKGWQISFDADDIVALIYALPEKERYRITTNSTFVVNDQNILESIRFQTIGEEDACKFLQDGQCELHREFGEEMLPRLCQVFPGFSVSLGKSLELHYDIVCPEVLNRIIDSSEPYRLQNTEIPDSGTLQTRATKPNEVPQLTLGQKQVGFDLFREIRQTILDTFNKRQWSAVDTLARISYAIARYSQEDGPFEIHSQDPVEQFYLHLDKCVSSHLESALSRIFVSARRLIPDFPPGGSIRQLTNCLHYDPLWKVYINPKSDEFDDLFSRYLCHRFFCAFDKNVGYERLQFSYGTITHTLATTFRFAVGFSKWLNRPVDKALLKAAICSSEYMYRILRMPPESMPWFGLTPS